LLYLLGDSFSIQLYKIAASFKTFIPL
jgi:hypothetical protein